MIDTVEVMAGLDSYALQPVSGTWRRDTETDYVTGEVTRSKAYCNLPRLNMTVGTDGILKMHTSAPKLLYGSSLSEVTDADLPLFKSKVEELAGSTGLDLDLDALRVIKLHYCRNLSVDHRVRDYLSLLQQYAMPRRERRSYDGETVLFYNGSRQLAVYDKRLEVSREAEERGESDLLERLNADPRKNVLRVESRLLRARPVQKAAGVVEAAHLADVWHGELSRSVLLSDFDAVVAAEEILPAVDFENLVTVLNEFRELFPRGGAFRVVEVDGLRSLLSACRGDWNLLRNALLESGYSQRSVRRILSRWRETFRASTPRDASALMREVRQKLAA